VRSYLPAENEIETQYAIRGQEHADCEAMLPLSSKHQIAKQSVTVGPSKSSVRQGIYYVRRRCVLLIMRPDRGPRTPALSFVACGWARKGASD
jgi:hypothetical protein